MHSIEQYVEDNMKGFDFIELTLMCYTFCMTSHAARESPFVHAITKRLHMELSKGLLIGERYNMNETVLKNILLALGHAYYTNVEFYERLGDVICDADFPLLHGKIIKPDCPAVSIADSYRRLGIKHAGLLRTIEKNIPESRTSQSSSAVPVLSKGLVELVHIYVRLQERPPKHWLDALLHELTSNMPVKGRIVDR